MLKKSKKSKEFQNVKKGEIFEKTPKSQKMWKKSKNFKKSQKMWRTAEIDKKFKKNCQKSQKN